MAPLGKRAGPCARRESSAAYNIKRQRIAPHVLLPNLEPGAARDELKRRQHQRTRIRSSREPRGVWEGRRPRVGVTLCARGIVRERSVKPKPLRYVTYEIHIKLVSEEVIAGLGYATPAH
ncbi:unnamed protein product, partial [Iphiclides podalirius]